MLLDIDGDGSPEILVPEFRSISVTENETETGLRIFSKGPDGRFHATGLVPGTYFGSLDVADVDGDGRLDLIARGSGNYAAGFQVFLNEGRKSPAAPTGLLPTAVVDIPVGARSPAVTSLNKDGKRQILMPVYPTGIPGQLPLQVLVFAQTERGVFTPDTTFDALFSNLCVGSVCVDLKILDIDGDGLPDLLFGGGYERAVAYVRRGATFIQAFNASLMGFVYVADADRDGLSDLMIVSSSGGGAFVAVGVGNRSTGLLYSRTYGVPLWNHITAESGAAVADIDGDGLPDFVVDEVNSGIYVVFQRKY